MTLVAQRMFDEYFREHLQDFGLRHDPVTGLPNHAFFRTSLRQLLNDSNSDGQEIALLWVEVLNLRREYLVGGAEAAVLLLRTVSDSLRPWIEPGELIAKSSDRCFLLALKCDERIQRRLSLISDATSHLKISGSEGTPEIAAGVAMFPEQTSDREELIRFASLAADSATRARSRTAILFQPQMNLALLEERAMEQDLRAALRDNQLTLAYQPQIDLRSGKVLGAEGLARWRHPTRGSVSPAQFIPVAERSNQIDELFTHSLRQLLKDAAEWRALGVTLPSISVNASAANVRQEDFVALVARELAANPLGSTQLEVEVTESLLMDDEELFRERLKGLRSSGVKVSLDDFGTRYTGFNALKGLPLNSMKIDKCFVHEVNRSSQAQSLCRTIVTMARHLKLSTVAEGIEDIAELRILRRIGCHAGQGYLFQRPVSPDHFLRFLAEWPERKIQREFAEVFSDSELNEDSAPEADPLVGVA